MAKKMSREEYLAWKAARETRRRELQAHIARITAELKDVRRKTA
jgi:hypothetical protein